MPNAIFSGLLGMTGYYPALHFDASTLGLTNGAAVSQWDDLSGRGFHASQGTGANQPVFVTNAYNSLPCVRFTPASSHYLNTATIPAIPHPTIFIVGKGTSLTTYLSSTSALFIQTNRIYAGVALTSPGISTSLTLSTTVFRRANAISRQGAVSTTGNAGALTMTDLYIGQRQGVGSFLNGDLCEIQVWSNLSDSAISIIEGALKTKWGTP